MPAVLSFLRGVSAGKITARAGPMEEDGWEGLDEVELWPAEGADREERERRGKKRKGGAEEGGAGPS